MSTLDSIRFVLDSTTTTLLVDSGTFVCECVMGKGIPVDDVMRILTGDSFHDQ